MTTTTKKRLATMLHYRHNISINNAIIMLNKMDEELEGIEYEKSDEIAKKYFGLTFSELCDLLRHEPDKRYDK